MLVSQKGATFFSAKGFLNEILLFFLVYKDFFLKIKFFSEYKLKRNRGGIPK